MHHIPNIGDFNISIEICGNKWFCKYVEEESCWLAVCEERNLTTYGTSFGDMAEAIWDIENHE